MPDNVREAVPAALLKALPAELVTRERPCCALPATSEALSLALAAALPAASEVVEAARLWTANLDWRRASLDTIFDDMAGCVCEGGCRVNGRC